jgi:hypothetical protein
MSLSGKSQIIFFTTHAGVPSRFATTLSAPTHTRAEVIHIHARLDGMPLDLDDRSPAPRSMGIVAHTRHHPEAAHPPVERSS